MEENRALVERLFAAAGYGDKAAELTDRLMKNCDSLPALLESAVHWKSSPLPDSLRALLALMPPLTRRRALDRLGPNPLLDNVERASAYASALYVGENYECIRLILLDDSFQLIDHCTLLKGGLKEVPFYPRRLLQETLRREAPITILCHNHPSGRPYFSEADASATRTLLRLYAAAGLGLIDHLLVTGEQVVSMRSKLIIPEKLWAAASPPGLTSPQWCKSGPRRNAKE